MKTQNPISVVLVDDDKTYLNTLKHYIREQFKSQIKIEACSSGEECLKKIEQGSETDMVILDYYLNAETSNAMNGIEILKKIKQLNSEITVIILSAQDKLEIATDSIKFGAYEYVVKSATAFVRTKNILKNLIVSISEAKLSKAYQKWNVIMAIIILILVLLDIIYYNSR